MKNLIKKVQNTSFQYGLFKKGDSIILAVSGGPDSVCLLDVFFKLQKKYELELLIAHVNYGLRDKDSDRDEKLVRGLAKKYNFQVEVLKVKNIKKKTEDEFRKIRYDFFEKIRSKNKFDYVAVAHNLDDQVETFLMRIVRGAGLKGLSAMRYKNNQIIRPLLGVSRKEIEKYLKDNNLTWRLDKTNLETKYLRNKLRNILIPILEKKFNPKIKQTIFDSLSTVSEDANFLDLKAEKYLNRSGELEIKKLKKLHPAILRRVLRLKLEKKKGDLKNITAAHIEEIIKIIKSDKNKNQIVLFTGLKITRKGDKLHIIRNT